MTEPTEEEFERADTTAASTYEAEPIWWQNLARCYRHLRQREARREELERRLCDWLKEKPWRSTAGHEERDAWLQFSEDGTCKVTLYYCNRHDRGESHDGHDEGVGSSPLDALEKALDALEAK